MLGMNKCVFLDRDGVLNVEIGRHIMNVDEFVVPEDVPDGLKRLKAAGYKLIVVTNQSGIARGYYEAKVVEDCHEILQDKSENALDQLYYAPLIDHVSKSLMRKPDSLMLEKGLAKFNGDPTQSWMIGDKERDLIPAKKLGIKAMQIMALVPETDLADERVMTFKEAVDLILSE
jgi:D-glycero-D-manno-heptose 1,7-bisphosphate phosphatase